VPIFLSGVSTLEPSRAFSYEERVAKALEPITPLYALARLVYPPEAYWTRPLKRVYEQLNNLLGRTKDFTILEIGGGLQSDGRKYLRPEINNHIINLDINYTEGVHLIGDAHQLPFKDNSFDAVMIQSVLEHVRDPTLVVAEIHRILNKNGLVYAMIPFIQGYHSYPGDYQRYTEEGLQQLFKHFKLVKSDVALGPASAFVMNTVYFFESFFDTEILKSTVRFVLRWLLFPVRYLDIYLLKKNSRNIIPAAVYYIGSKEQFNEKDLTHKVVKIFKP
jgi:SAM-dependent methyltransferase